MSYSWDKKTTNELISLIYNGKSINEISNNLNLDDMVIYRKVILLNRGKDKNIKNKLEDNNINYEKSFKDFNWNPQLDEKLIQLRKDGMTYKEISKDYINTTIEQLQNRVKELNIEPLHKKRWSVEEENQAKNLYIEGNNFTTIGEIMKRSSESIRQKLISLGVINKIKWSDNDDKALMILCERYSSSKEIAEILNVKIKDVENRMINLGIIKNKLCKRCGDEKIIKSGKYKGYCKMCAGDLKALDKVNEEVNIKKQENKKIIENYIQNNKNTLTYCSQCNEEKDVYNDYYYSVSTSKEGYKYVNKECKKCSKKRNDEKKIINLKNKGYR